MKILIALLVILVTVLCVDYEILFKEQVDFENLRHPFTGKALSSLSFVEKRGVVYHALKTTADLTQRYVRELLDNQGCKYKSFWIYNTIVVHDPDEELLKVLQKRDEVKSVKKVPNIEIPLKGDTNNMLLQPDLNGMLRWRKLQKFGQRDTMEQELLLVYLGLK